MQKEILTITNNIAEIEKIHSFVQVFGKNINLSNRCINSTNLAIEEIVSNVITYGYTDSEQHMITISLFEEEVDKKKRVNIDLEDDAKKFNPFDVEYNPPKNFTLDQIEDISLGIHFIRILVDGYNYEYRSGKNHLKIFIIDEPNKKTITSVLTETRVFQPPAELQATARINSIEKYKEIYEYSIKYPEKFWAEKAEELHWFKKWDKVLESDFAEGKHKWFINGRINITDNCLDRFLSTSVKDKTAILWEGDNPGETKKITYFQLHNEVCRFSNVLKKHGVKKGDRVTIYLPMIPELPVVMLACARIGAIHSIVFGGFSAESLKDRMIDCGSKVLICADGYYRAGKVIKSKENADKAVEHLDFVNTVIVVRRTCQKINLKSGRDFLYDEEMNSNDITDTCEPEVMESSDPLFILYTSSSTGKPKGVMHCHAGYLLYVNQTFKNVFDIKDNDIYWCTADIGWITGHSYIIYGPLSNAATIVMYEGAPNYPNPGRFWDIVEKYRVTIFYTAPTAIRALMKEGDEWPRKYDLNSLRLLGTVGEPINPEAWMWYYEVIGKGKCPVIDTWWQTETGGILIAPLPGAVSVKPGSATLPMFGIKPEVIKENMSKAAVNEGGWLVIRHPWPGLMAGVYGDEERFKKTYFSQFYGVYTTGDSARTDEDGYFWLMGRIDDVINVSGHRLGTAEIESAFVSHHAVAESAVVGIQHDIKGQGIYAFIILKSGVEKNNELMIELKNHIRSQIGPIATPDKIQFTEGLPKTRSGKIMRRILTKIASGDVSNLGDTTTLTDPSVIEELIKNRI
ncbi:acetate--CoA ligase [Candidatus Dependentiae bacterium]|nr:acetate--CoA ligase [Candidatus Dependentiae bacterium]